MKVTATGVSEDVVAQMFNMWIAGLGRDESGNAKVNVCFISENENART